MNEWHFIDFKIKWDRISPPKFFIDLLIIDLLINPTIKKFRSEVVLWRFHRRASPDKDGHRLKFVFYTTDEISNKVFKHIESNAYYDFIINNYLEISANVGIFDTDEDPCRIEATGDGTWPLEVNKAWPYYIMGVCDMFIHLIEEIQKKKVKKINTNNREQLEVYYKEIEKTIDEKWLKYGQHAFLHHLGAIFGYKRISFVSREKAIKGFPPEEVIL